MISSINSGMSMPQPMARSEAKLSEEQQALISDTLSELDADNLTETDALSIIESFSEAGIQPGKAMESAISDLGFDAQSIGELANVQGSEGKGAPPPPPPPQDAAEVASMTSYLEELLEEQMASIDGDEISDQDMQSIYSQVMEKFGIEEDDSLINTTA